MNKRFTTNNSTVFWSTVARLILRNRTILLVAIVAITIFLAMQWQHMRFTYTEANLLPDDHPINLEYNAFLEIFGEEGTLIVLGVKDSTLFTPEKFNAWNALSRKLKTFDEVETTISLADLKQLVKVEEEEKFKMSPFFSDTIYTKKILDQHKYDLFINFLFMKA